MGILFYTSCLGRWGGEEFLLICPGTPNENTAQLSEKLREKVEKHDFPTVGQVTASFGVAQCREGESLSQLISRADAGLYQAKAEGRNRVIITSEEPT